MLDPPVGESARPRPTLEALLKEWGITLGHDVVIDVSGMGQLLGTDASVPVVADLSVSTRSPRTSTCSPRFRWRSRCAARPASSSARRAPQNVLKTSDRSWSESDVKSLAAGRQGLARRKGRRSHGPDHDRAVAVDGCAGRAGRRPATPREAAQARSRRRSRRCASSSSATPTSRRTPRPACRATPTCSSTSTTG